MFLHVSVCLQGMKVYIQEVSLQRVYIQGGWADLSPPPNQKVGGTHPTGMLSSYEGYVFTGVCLSTGGCLIWGCACLVRGVPGLRGGSALGGIAWSGVAWSRGVPAWSRGAWSGGVLGPGEVGIPACTEADPPRETATAADGTHSTGMFYSYYYV